MSKKVELDYKVFDALMQFKVTCDFCADYMGISRDAIIRRLKEDHGMTFSEYNKLKMQRTAIKLQQKAIEMALSGKHNSIMIFALKNIANWSDKVDESVSGELSIKIAEQDKDL